MKTYINNRKAFFNFDIKDTYTAGIVLTGVEVKSIRGGGGSLLNAFVYVKDNEVFIKNFLISRPKGVSELVKHDDSRDKKLLLNKKEIEKIVKETRDKGTTIIPLGVKSIKNRIRVEIGIATGKKKHDKKNTIKERDIDRDSKRERLGGN